MQLAYKEGVYIAPDLLARPADLFHLDRIQQTALRTAPDRMVDDLVMVTSISRPKTGQFTYHHVGRAIDFRTGLDLPDNSLLEPEDLVWSFRPGAIDTGGSTADVYFEAMAWAQRLRGVLGNGYDVVYGIDRKHWNHIHVERDKRDGGMVL